VLSKYKRGAEGRTPIIGPAPGPLGSMLQAQPKVLDECVMVDITKTCLCLRKAGTVLQVEFACRNAVGERLMMR
jgi:hypothetical protein